MNTLIIILVVCMFYWRVKNLYQSYLSQKYRYQLFSLRDKLRRKAIDGEIDAKNWSFNYLDTSISKTISELDSLNLYVLIRLYLKHKDREEFKKFRLRSSAEINKSTQLLEVYEEYSGITSRYVIDKHFIVKTIIDLGLSSLLGSIRFINILKSNFRKSSASIGLFPETSTARNFRLA